MFIFDEFYYMNEYQAPAVKTIFTEYKERGKKKMKKRVWQFGVEIRWVQLSTAKNYHCLVVGGDIV